MGAPWGAQGHGAPWGAQGHGPQGPMGLKDPGLKDLGPRGMAIKDPGLKEPGAPWGALSINLIRSNAIRKLNDLQLLLDFL